MRLVRTSNGDHEDGAAPLMASCWSVSISRLNALSCLHFLPSVSAFAFLVPTLAAPSAFLAEAPTSPQDMLALPFLHRFLTSFTASQQHDSILKGDSSAFLVPGPALMDRLKGLVQLGQCCAPSRKEVEKERGEEGGG